MNEERWHILAKEKPSEDMEGRNFIVSNGHYEKIATWCGYWETEPFMGDRLCDEVVRWKFYFTPEEEKANEATCKELKAIKQGSVELGEYWVYDADDVDALLAEKDKEIAELKQKLEDVNELIKTARQMLEDAKATHYAEMVDAGMRERRLRRALWLARAELCRRLDVDRYLRNHRNSWYNENLLTFNDACVAMEVKMCDAESKCRAKAEEYK